MICTVILQITKKKKYFSCFYPKSENGELCCVCFFFDFSDQRFLTSCSSQCHHIPCHEFSGYSRTLLHTGLEPRYPDACRLTLNNTDCFTISILAKDLHTRNECAAHLRYNLGEKLFVPFSGSGYRALSSVPFYTGVVDGLSSLSLFAFIPALKRITYSFKNPEQRWGIEACRDQLCITYCFSAWGFLNISHLFDC